MTARGAPVRLLAQLRDSLDALSLRRQRLLVAVSGGVDSTALLHALSELAPEFALRLAVGHVNHGLRGAESAGDERFVRDLAAQWSAPFQVRRADPRPLCSGSSRTRPTLQEAARRLRYAALLQMAQGGLIATAHTQDDQAETVLLRLLRGAGPDGLGGIPERGREGRVVRPLLGVSRAEVLDYARARGFSWREDSSNRDAAFARARLRLGGLAELAEALNPAWRRAAANLAEAQRRESEWIEALVAREAKQRFTRSGAGLCAPRQGWDELPEGLLRRLVHFALRELSVGRDLSRVHILRVADFLRGARTGARLELPGGLWLRCERGGFHFMRAGPSPPGRGAAGGAPEGC